MNVYAKGFLILMVMCLPAAVWLPGPWWAWLVTAVALFVAAAIADQDETGTSSKNNN